MRRDKKRSVGGLLCAALLAAALLAAAPPARARADEPPRLSATQGIAIGGSVANSTITSTVNQENPATLAMLAKALSDKDASEEKRRAAEAKVAELATKWGFTSAAVAKVFKILGEDVPEDKAPARLIEIATHFAQTRDTLALLDSDDPRAAELAEQAKRAFDAGQLTEADRLLEQAHDAEMAAQQKANQLIQKMQEASDRRAVNLAKIEASRGDIALTQRHYVDAAKHYEAAAAQLPSSALENIAFYLYQAGSALETFGDSAAALSSYSASRDIAERLARSDSGNALWQHDLSVSYNKVGNVQVAQGELLGALKSYRDSLAVRERLVKSNPGNALWQRDLAGSHEKVGNVQVDQGDLQGALKSYRDSLAIAERLARSDPGNALWQRDLSVSYEKVGNVQVDQGDLPGALKCYGDSLAIRERLARSDPGNAGWKRDLSVSYERVGDVEFAEGDLPSALTSYHDSLAIRERLAQSDPGNAGWQRDLSVSYERVGDVLTRRGETSQAIAAFQRALDVYRDLQARNAGDTPSRVYSVVPLWRLGRLKGKEGRADLVAALAILKPLAEADRLDTKRRGWIGQIQNELSALPP